MQHRRIAHRNTGAGFLVSNSGLHPDYARYTDMSPDSPLDMHAHGSGRLRTRGIGGPTLQPARAVVMTGVNLGRGNLKNVGQT